MRYALIREMDISNGEHIGVSLFVQGCNFHCKGCFNQETWDFNGGKEFTQEIEDKFFELVNRPYIKRISILGGEPLADMNVLSIFNLIQKVKDKFPNKTIWLYTGYTWNQIFYSVITNNFNPDRDQIIDYRKKIVEMCDVLVDGRYVDELKDLTLKFRGSSNQRVIDIQETIKQGKIITI